MMRNTDWTSLLSGADHCLPRISRGRLGRSGPGSVELQRARVPLPGTCSCSGLEPPTGYVAAVNKIIQQRSQKDNPFRYHLFKENLAMKVLKKIWLVPSSVREVFDGGLGKAVSK